MATGAVLYSQPNQTDSAGGTPSNYDLGSADSVKQLQFDLNSRGENLAIDGQYGPLTQAALLRQGGQENNLNYDQNGQQATLGPATPTGFISGQPVHNSPYLQDPSEYQSYYNSAPPDEQAKLTPPQQYQQSYESEHASATAATLKSVQDQIAKMAATISDTTLRDRINAAASNGDIQSVLDLNARLASAIGDAKARAAAAQKAQDNSLKGKVLRNVVKPVFGAVEKVTEPLQRALYAQELDKNRGGSLLDQLETFVSGLPLMGKGGLNIDRNRPDIQSAVEATNTRAERQNLTNQGQLQSLGQIITGANETPNNSIAGKILGVTQHLSGVVDLGMQLALDPTMLAQAGLKPLENVGDVAARRALDDAANAGADLGNDAVRTSVMKAGRDEFLNTNTGQKILGAAVNAVEDSRDATQLGKRLNMATTVAKDITDAAANGTTEDVVTAIEDAFINGTWKPNISLVRQLTGIGVSAAVAPSERILGIIPKDAVSRFVRGTGEDFATGESHAARQALESTLQRTAQVAKSFRGDIIQKVTEPLKKMSLQQRITRISLLADHSDVAAFRDAAHEELGRISKTTGDAAKERIVSRLEAVQASLDGKFGADAAKQATSEMSKGFVRTEDQVVERAAKSAGIGLPKTTPQKYTKAAGKALASRIEKEVPKGLQAAIKADLEKAIAAKKGLGRVAREIDLSKNSKVAEEALRELGNKGERISQALSKNPRGSLVSRLLSAPARGVGQTLLDINEKVAPRTAPFQRGAYEGTQIQRRVDAVDRWATSIGADDTLRQALRSAAEHAQTEEELTAVVSNGIAQIAKREGVNADDLVAVYKASVAAAKSEKKASALFGVDEAGKGLSDIQTLSQRLEDIPLPNAEDIHKAIKLLRKDAGPNELKAALEHAKGDTNKLANLLSTAHHLWKFSIVSNAYMPVVGAVAGFTQGNSLGQRLENAGKGAAIGLLGPARYVLRVPIIENRIRYYLERGLNPAEWIPGLAKFYRTHGLEDTFLSTDLVHSSGMLEAADKQLHGAFATSAPGFTTLATRDSRYIDGLSRIINHQLNPEGGDELARIFLNEKAGLLSTGEAVAEAKAFLKTDDGRVLRDRFAGGLGGTSKPAEIIDRYRSFVDHNLTPDLARARLDGPVSSDLIKQTVKAEAAAAKQAGKLGLDMSTAADSASHLPDVIHVQNTWTMPKNISQVKQTLEQASRNLIFDGPHTKFVNEPLAEAIYRDEYTALRDSGVDHIQAQQIADELAARRTRQIMYFVDDQSRFAKKIDIVAPFQGPKESALRVFGKLIADNPYRVIHVAHDAAVAFNNGQQDGMFRRTPYGDWVMSHPMGGLVSNLLFGVNARYDLKLKDMLLFTQGAFSDNLGIGLGGLPTPGGPFMAAAGKLLQQVRPDVYNGMPDWLQQTLFPYGNTGQLFRNETDRLWWGITGEPFPGDFLDVNAQQDAINKWTVEVYLQMKQDHLNKTGDANWEPTPQEVRDATKSFFQAWSIIGSISPAAPQPVFLGRDAFNAAVTAHTHNGVVDWTQLRKDVPLADLYLTPDNKYVGPDDYQHWSTEDQNKAQQYVDGNRVHLTLQQFQDVLKANKATSAAWAEFNNDLAIANPWDREAALEAWRAAHPDLAQQSRNDYFAEQDLQRILQYPVSMRAQAIDRWRKQYNMTAADLTKLTNRINTLPEPPSPWKAARYTEDVVKDVQAQVRRGVSEVAYVATLLPAEQINYWKYKQSQLNYTSGDPQTILNQYNQYGQYMSAVYNQHPELTASSKPKSASELAAEKFDGDVRNQISAIYAELDRIRPAMMDAANAKQWTTYYQLRDKEQALYDQIRGLQNSTYHTMPDIDKIVQGVKDLLVGGNPLQDGIPWIPSDEESHYLGMPTQVQATYVQNIVNGLNTAYGQKGKLYWENLTNFQQDLLEKNLPAAQVSAWQHTTYAAEAAAAKAKTASTSGGGTLSGKFFRANNTIDNGGGELAYALQMFNQYNQRPAGAQPPAAYAQYQALPNNPAVKSQFLKDHPDVANWIKEGPLANMPEEVRLIVTNIMIKYGKWDGVAMDNNEITDLAFAKDQLQRWNKRGDQTAPDAYAAWLAMPVGPDKTAYKAAHPEIQKWIDLGPMANMPAEYQTVVRDIMLRYGEWTQNQDPLGDTISQYYALPSYARQDFLKQHPELTDYWASLRTPEQQRLANLSDQYFSLQDTNAKKALLSANPELQQYFVDQRNKRYETFLNQVAQYMGSNPDLLTQYLNRQSDIMAQMLNKWAQPVLIREARPITHEGSRSSEAKRVTPK